jgi:hypothetical protein
LQKKVHEGLLSSDHGFSFPFYFTTSGVRKVSNFPT